MNRTRWWLLAGALTTAALTVAPVIDMQTGDSIAAHVRDAYPQWSASNVDADRTAIGIYLVSVGALGVVGWVLALWVARRPERTARWTTTTLLGLGAAVALTNLSMGGEAYDRIVPTPYAIAWLVPVLIGVVAVLQVWRGEAARR
jgi:hypothetical protein